MVPFHVALSVAVLLASAQDQPPTRPSCRAWQECRQLAADAAERKDYETFHDLAWRAVQTGPKNDPELMYMLARAQSLSGRPGDALVMLQRLAALGASNDAETNDDFRRVRALAGWAARHNAGEPVETSPARPAAVPAPAPAPPAMATEIVPKRTPAPIAGSPSAAAPEPAESIRFTAPLFTPAGLAYDAVSRRFIVGDRRVRKLTVVDEFSQHVANLASAQTAGFGEIAALEIDPRQGDLWVVSGDAGRAALHKLQLISGRVLATFEVPAASGDARFADVAIVNDGTVLLLDAAGGRVFRLRPKAESLEVVSAVADEGLTSLAPAPGAVVYVAHERGVSRLDLASRATAAVKAGDGIELAGITRIRWHDGALVGIQQTGGGAWRAVRIRLNRAGQAAIAIDVLDPSLSTADPTAASVGGDTLYYLASGEGAEMIVKKVSLRKAER